jgi:large subunit ribosomal protein L13
MKFTKPTKEKDIKREWHLVDVSGKILGRETTKIALLLTGKGKSNFVRNLDLGDFVVVVNASLVKVTGNKENLKKYFRHSGYPGGFREQTFSDLIDRKPEEIIRHAVSGMLPQNKLKRSMLKRLHVFAGSEHKFLDKFKN